MRKRSISWLGDRLYTNRRLVPMQIPATWPRVLRLWRALICRTVLIMCPIAFILTFAVNMLLTIFGPQLTVFNLQVGLICAALAPIPATVIALKQILGKTYGEFRLELTPYDAEAMAKRLAPRRNEIVVEGELLSRNHPPRMKIAINGEPRYTSRDMGIDGLIIFDLDGNKVAELVGKTIDGKYAYRLVSSNDTHDEILLSTLNIHGPEFIIGKRKLSIISHKHTQIVDVMKMKLTMTTSTFRAEGLRSDANITSEPLLIALLCYAHLPWRNTSD